MPNSKPILLVEDDCVDVMAVQRVLKELQVTNELVHAANGEEALTYLRDPNHARPCVILLDLNMPKMNGLELLEILWGDEALNNIPAIVVTTSVEQEDMAVSAKLGAVAYIVKSYQYREFRERMNAIRPYLGAARPAQEPVSASL